jgi:hypothetical protein
MDSILLSVAKYAVEKQRLRPSDLQIEFKIGQSRALRLINDLEELGIIQELESPNEWQSKVSNDFLLGKYFPANQIDIDACLKKLNDEECSLNSYELDAEFDYSFNLAGQEAFDCSILSYYLIKGVYWSSETTTRVSKSLLGQGAEVNPIVNFSGDGLYLIDYLLKVLEGQIYPSDMDRNKASFHILQKYFEAITFEGKWDNDIMEPYYERLKKFEKK